MRGGREPSRFRFLLLIGLLVREAFSFWTGHPFDFEIWVRTGLLGRARREPLQRHALAPGVSFANDFGYSFGAAIGYLPFWPVLRRRALQALRLRRLAHPVPLLLPAQAADHHLRRPRRYYLYRYVEEERLGQGLVRHKGLALVAAQHHRLGDLGDVRLDRRALRGVRPHRPPGRLQRVWAGSRRSRSPSPSSMPFPSPEARSSSGTSRSPSGSRRRRHPRDSLAHGLVVLGLRDDDAEHLSTGRGSRCPLGRSCST